MGQISINLTDNDKLSLKKEAKKQNQSSEEQPNIDDNKQEEVHNND